MGIFKPAWQSKNELKALGSLGKITDPVILAEISQNAPLAKVREVAAARKEVFEREALKNNAGIIEPYLCPLCGAATQGATHTCTNCDWDESICPYVAGFNTKDQLYEKCRLITGNNFCISNPYGYLYEICPIYTAQTSGIRGSNANILDNYRHGLSYLDGCQVFDEVKFREFNRIIGNQFSDTDIEKQLRNASMMMKGMEDLKQALRSSTVEAIRIFEKIENE